MKTVRNRDLALLIPFNELLEALLKGFPVFVIEPEKRSELIRLDATIHRIEALSLAVAVKGGHHRACPTLPGRDVVFRFHLMTPMFWYKRVLETDRFPAMTYDVSRPHA